MAEYATDTAKPEGGFLSNIPMWVWIAGAGIIILILFVMGRSSTSSGSSAPLTSVSSDPNNTSTLANLSSAISQLGANQSAITDAINGISATAPVAAPASTGPVLLPDRIVPLTV